MDIVRFTAQMSATITHTILGFDRDKRLILSSAAFRLFLIASILRSARF